MGLKYSTTTADYLEWDVAMNLIRKLTLDENYKMSLLIAIGCFTGLRISDILALRWNQILNTEEFSVIEKKTGKKRIIRLNPQLQKHIKECYPADGLLQACLTPVQQRANPLALHLGPWITANTL